MSQLNTITLGEYDIYDAPSNFNGQINYIDFFTGASKYAIGHFLMVRSDYDSLVSDTNDTNSTASLVLSCPQGSTISGTSSLVTDPGQGNSITLSVLIAGCKTLSGSVSGYTPDSDANSQNYFIGSPDDMVEVIVRDQRYTQNQTVTAAYNVQLDGFPYSGSTPLFYPETYLTGTTQYGWDDVATAISSLSSVTTGSNVLSIPYSDDLPAPEWNPRNLIFDGVPWNRVVDNIAARLFFVTGYDPVNNIYSWNLPGVMTDNNNLLLNTAMGFNSDYTGSYLNAGNVGERNLASLPASYDICFESYGVNDPFTLLSSTSVGYRQYKKNVATGFSNASASVIQPITYGDFIAIYNSTSTANTPVNQAELNIVALDIGARAASFQSQPIYQLEFIGLWNFTLDGAIRGMRWISDSNGCRTILRFNNDREFSPIDESYRASENLANQLVVGLGSGRATNNPAGTRNFYSSNSTGAFIVSLTGTGGSNGSSSSAPSYTYSASIVGTSTVIATGLTPAYRPLQYGELYATASYGEAVYVNGSLILITAYETWQTGVCP